MVKPCSFIFFFFLSFGYCFISKAQSVVPEWDNKLIKVKPVIPISAYSFNLKDVQLSPGSPFYHARSMDSAYLVLINPYRLLTRFYINAGLSPKDSLYGGWENSGLSGHTLGHYLSAASMMYASTGSIVLKNKIDILIHELNAIQIKRKSGYLGGIPLEDSIFAKVQRGQIKSSGFDLNGGWSPWYTVHKIMAGLCDVYLYTSNPMALTIVTKMADWVHQTVNGLNDSTRLKMLNCEYGGMNDVLANIYSFTGNKKYLKLSYKFYDEFVMGQLAKGIDPLPGKHSNTNVPKAIGSARQYELTGQVRDKKIADVFWNVMVHDHTYSIGGNSNYEYCGDAGKLNDGLSDNTCETCNTYNMLKLTRHLFSWSPGSNYMDFYERALYNHILASQHPNTGMMTYFVPLRMGTKKTFSDTFNTFTCCVGSGMENHSKYQEQIYSHDGKNILFVNLFIPSELKWKQQDLSMSLKGDFPNENTFSLTLNSQPKANTIIAIRHPFWSDKIGLQINDIPIENLTESNGYVMLKHKFKKNDVIRITLNESLYTEPMPDNPDRVSFKYGPLVLAADLGKSEPGELDIPILPSEERSINHWLKKSSSGNLAFELKNNTKSTSVELKPFYQVYDSYYNVYFDYMTTQQWDKVKSDHFAEIERIKNLESHTIDYIIPGKPEDEKKHNLTNSERSYVEDALGRPGREARSENYFQFELLVNPSVKNQLVLTYIGDDKNRIWDILLDDTLLSTVDWKGGKTGKFYDLTYDLPTTLIDGKQKVMIKILANHGKTAGRIFGARTIFIN
ncbi:MAG: beta-L-arabinofuranosidase domain-containing protein [Saprospiraceae bacterium]